MATHTRAGFQMPTQFEYGYDSLSALSPYLDTHSIDSALLVTDQRLEATGIIDTVIEQLVQANIDISMFKDVTTEPTFDIARRAVDRVEAEDVEMVIGLGGGSVLDTAKTASIVSQAPKSLTELLGFQTIPNPGLPLVLIPTTAGTGSEVSNGAVLTDNQEGYKHVLIDDHLFADLSIVDPALTESLPSPVAASTGADALTHAIEAYVTTERTPMTDMLCLDAIERIGNGYLPAVTANERDARYNMSLAASHAGMAFTNAGLGAVHALTYPVGKQFHLGHGLVNGLLLPYVMQYNVTKVPERYSDIGDAIGAFESPPETAIDAGYQTVEYVHSLLEAAGLPTALKTVVNAPNPDFEEFSEIALEYSTHNIENNPRQLGKKRIIAIFEAAFEGDLQMVP
jgi:alcohol dehydrogenase